MNKTFKSKLNSRIPIESLNPQGELARKLAEDGFNAFQKGFFKALEKATTSRTGGKVTIWNASDNCSLNCEFHIEHKIKVPGVDEAKIMTKVKSVNIKNTDVGKKVRFYCELKDPK